MSCRCDALLVVRIWNALALSVAVLSRYRCPNIVVAVVGIVVVVVVVVAVVSAVFVHPGSVAPPELPENWGGVFGDDEVPRVAREAHGP